MHHLQRFNPARDQQASRKGRGFARLRLVEDFPVDQRALVVDRDAVVTAGLRPLPALEDLVLYSGDGDDAGILRVRGEVGGIRLCAQRIAGCDGL
jgi:hypothetical protein